MRIQLSPRELADLIREIATVREDSWVRKPGNRQHSVEGGHYLKLIDTCVREVCTKREVDPKWTSFLIMLLSRDSTWNPVWGEVLGWCDEVIEKETLAAKDPKDMTEEELKRHLGTSTFKL